VVDPGAIPAQRLDLRTPNERDCPVPPGAKKVCSMSKEVLFGPNNLAMGTGALVVARLFLSQIVTQRLLEMI
jgi:hypothetical protein